jgi:cation diffusion facilitator family transporter
LSVGASSNSKLLHIINASASGTAVIPTFPALIMAFLSIVSKEWLFRITRTVGEELNSQVVIANAWHHRSDAYSSILAMGSIGLAMSIPGMAFADAAAGLLVAGMICMTGAEIMGEAVKQLTDANDKEIVERVKTLILGSSDDVVDVKRVRARWMGSTAIVDVSITTSDNMSASANRAVEEKIRYKILDEESGVIDAEVHATSNAITCPLLTATGAHEEMKSVQEVEDDAREILSGHADVSVGLYSISL